MGDNGTSLPERFMHEALSNAAARFLDSLKINSISEAVRRGRRVVIKPRHVYSEHLTELANFIFSHLRLAGPFLDQNRRLATLGIKWVQDAFQNLHRTFCFARRRGGRCGFFEL